LRLKHMEKQKFDSIAHLASKLARAGYIIDRRCNGALSIGRRQ